MSSNDVKCEVRIREDLNEKIDVIDFSTATAFEMKVSGKNAGHEFYKDIFKVLIYNHAEYRDASFTQRLGITLNRRSRESFWPERGPQWDALGKTDSGKVILVEAKAHLNEVVSPGTQASEISRKMIIRSLEETKVFLKVRPNIDWSGTFYQYTNRLAHLYLLRILNGIDSYLVFVYFLNDDEVEGPKLVQEWQAGIRVLEAALGLRIHGLSRFILEIFIDVRELSSPVLS